MFRLSFDVHRKLSEKSNPTPVDLFLLGQTFVADASGYANPREIDIVSERQKRQDWLTKSAERGFAQACNELGRQSQKKQDLANALVWYKRSAEIGLAEGMKNVGALLMAGQGAERDATAAAEVTLEAAKRGDVFAMVNLAVWYDRGWGVESNREAARDWIMKAAQTGHWMGPMECGLALLTGNYGFQVDRPRGMRQLQRAVETGCKYPLSTIAGWYAAGSCIGQDGKRAVELAEAAFVQGSTEAAKCLATIYRSGASGIAPNERLSKYWSIQSNPSMAFAYHVDANYPDMTQKIAMVDPLAIRLVPERPESARQKQRP